METVVLLDKDGVRVDPSSLQTSRDVWQAVATSATAAGGATDLAVAERTYLTAKAAQIADVGEDGKIAIFDIPRSWNGIRLRAQADDATGTYVVQVYFGTLGDGNKDSDNSAGTATFDCELAYFGQFTWTMGTQASITSGQEMAGTLVVVQTGTSYPTIAAANIQSPTGNRVAETRFDLLGADIMVIVPTTIGADSKLLAKGY